MNEHKRKLFDLGYLDLQTGSWIRWMHRDWFDRFKPYLSFKNGRWIPIYDREKLNLLDAVTKAYEQWEAKAFPIYRAKGGL